MRSLCRSTPVFLLSLLCAHSVRGADRTAEAPGGPASIQPRIVNGISTSDHPTTGALLRGSDPETASSWCSGTLIGCQTFLTAAHCVCDLTGPLCQGPGAPDPSSYAVFFQHAGLFGVSSIAVHSNFSFPVADVAIVKLANPVVGIAPTPINTQQPPPFGTAGTIAGFGRSGGGSFDYGLERSGQVVTAPCSPDISNQTSVCWNFESPIGPPGQDSNTCNADSGGPLFVDFGFGEVVAGSTSGGSSSSCLPLDRSYDANLFHYRSWIETQGGPDLGQAFCGGLAQVGEPGAEVLGAAGQLGAGVPEGRHSFSITPGAQTLRITMNAIDDGLSDYDLYVKQGSPPTPVDFDCRQNGSGQFGACELPGPAGGPWHVLVERVRGSGEYQVTTTALAPRVALLSASPGRLDFPAAPLGTSPADSITLGDVGGGPVTVTAIDPGACPFFDLTLPALPFTLGAGDTRSVGVRFVPPFNAPFTCSIAIASNDPVNPVLDVPLSGTASAGGAGVTCDLTLDQPIYAPSDPLVATSARLANPATLPARVRIHFILRLGTFPSPVVPLATIGRDGGLFLGAGLDTNIGPLTLLPTLSSLPAGSHQLLCGLTDPVTGELLSTDLNPFTIE